MAISVINQWPLSDTNGYGPVQAKVSNVATHALVAFIAVSSDSEISGSAGYVPRLTVSDDAHNAWQFAGSAYLELAGDSRRVDCWVCPNANTATIVNVSSNIIYAGMLGVVCEVTGFPTWASVDFAVGTGNTGTSWSINGSPNQADFIMGASFFFGFTPTGLSAVTPATSNATTFQNTSTGLTDMSQISGNAFWYANTANTVQTYTQSWTGSGLWSAIVVGFNATPPTPVSQPNTNWPGIKVEAAFGWQPGNLTGIMPTWTDITSRAIGPDGTTIMKTSRGREYELAQPEAGQLTLSLNNHDGAFSSQATSSPFYPNVVPEVPIRVSAFWQGKQYSLGYFYANKWSMAFPDPQWGWMTLNASDAIGMASQGQMTSAYAAQVLSDFAYAYWPFGEYYQAPHGAIFANLSRTNQKPMVGYSPSGFTTNQALSTGQTMNLAGDPATGIGMTNFTATNFNTLEGGPGALVRDYSFPPLANGAAFEFWTTNIPTGAGQGTCQVLTASGMPSNYLPAVPSVPNGTRLTVLVSYQNPGLNWEAVLYSPTGTIIASTNNTTASVTALNHVVVNVSQSGSTWTLSIYLNGSLLATTTGTSSATLDWSVLTVGPVIPTGGVALTNDYADGQVAVYPWALPAKRAAEHYTTGTTANNGDSLVTRIGRLFQWAALSSLPVGVSQSPPSPFMGNADQIQGTALADVLYATSTDEGGMYYAPATLNGEIWYDSRTSLYNQPSVATFGDNGTSEIPFQGGTGFDYGDQFLYNIVSSQRTINAGTQLFVNNGVGIQQQYNNYGANAIVADIPSEQEYMARGPLQQAIETTSDQDAYDRASWSLAKYKQPQLRANQIKVDCASYPTAFATMLGIEQGDIVTVNRRPIGAPIISLNCIVQKVQHNVGPNRWDVILSLAPYFPDNAVIQLDNPNFDQLQDGALGW